MAWAPPPPLPDGLELLPRDEALVVLEPPASTGAPWKIIDLFVQERVHLPEPKGAWRSQTIDGFVVLHDDGAEDGDEDAVLLAEDIFSKVHVRDSTTQAEFIYMRRRSGRTFRISVFNFMTDHKEATITLRLGAARAEAKFDAVMLRAPRPGNAAFYWKGVQFYSRLNLTSYKATPSKWLFYSVGSSRRYMENIGLDKALVLRSRGAEPEELEDGAAPDVPYDRFLPFCGISTAALIALMARWAKKKEAMVV